MFTRIGILLIVANLTYQRMQFDARGFSVRMFSLSNSIEWCLSYNDQLRRKKGKMSTEFYSCDPYNFDITVLVTLETSLIDIMIVYEGK